MSEPYETDPPEDDLELLAAEYVLGLLSLAELPHVMALRDGSPRFDQAVQLWESRLLPLAEDLAPIAPSPRVWAAIANAIRPAPVRRGVLESLNFWRGFSLATGALCAGLIAAILLHRPPAQTAPAATAMLASSSDGIFVATAEPAAGGTLLVVSPSQVAIPPGKAAELWLITPGHRPAALGLLDAGHAVAITIPASQLPADLRLVELAISIEPPGGSPTGQATGPVIAAGRFLPL